MIVHIVQEEDVGTVVQEIHLIVDWDLFVEIVEVVSKLKM